jgi:hypothetical protein
MEYKNAYLIEAESRMVITRGWGEWGSEKNGKRLIRGYWV